MKSTLRKCTVLALFLAATVAANAADRILIRLTKTDGTVVSDVTATATAAGTGFFEVQNISFSTEQVLNIGSQTSGAGAGKITFNPFSFTLPSGSLDAILFLMQSSGAAFKTMEVQVFHAGTTPSETFNMKLVAVKTMSWSADSTGDKTTVTMEYGSLLVAAPSSASGKTVIGGWNRVNNTQDLVPVTKLP